MHCEQARQLFDAYLDGELSPALRTELGAHKVKCPDCRRALALLEVSGHVIGTDCDEAGVDGRFADRLLACMDEPTIRWPRRFRRALYVAGPLAAAAVIALAFLGVFDRPEAFVAGEKVEAPEIAQQEDRTPRTEEVDPVRSSDDRRGLDEIGVRMHDNITAKLRDGQAVQDYLKLTIRQWLDILEQAKDPSAPERHFPGSDAAEEREDEPKRPLDADAVEDR